MTIRKGFLFCVCALMSCGAFGAQAPSKTAALSGIVKDLKSGAPLMDARVSVTPEPLNVADPRRVTAITGEDGLFTITGLAPGRYSVEVTAVLYFRPSRGAGITSVTLGSEDVMRDIEFGLMPAGVISGRVLDEAGEPMRSVGVQALRIDYSACLDPIPNCGQRWVSASAATSDDRGEYRLFGLRPGVYRIRAKDSQTTDIGPLYYPGVADPQGAQSISIEAGQERGGIDIFMRRESEFALTFRFAGTSDFGDTQVTFRRKGDFTFDEARTTGQADGVRRLANLSPGSYELHASIESRSRDGSFYSGVIPFTIVDRDVDLGVWNVPPSVPVTGRIRTNALAPQFDFQRIRLSFHGESGSYLEVRHDPNAADRDDIAPDGRFMTPNVAVERYRMEVSFDSPDPSEAVVLLAARVGRDDVMDSGYLVTGSQDPLELIIGGPESVGTVEGRVIDATGAIVPGSVVVLAPSLERQANPAAFRLAQANEAGVFKMAFILPGEYRLLAWVDIEPDAALSPEFLKDFMGRGKGVSVAAGLSVSVVVEAIPAVD